jgi:hypothetical protein
MFGRHKQTNLSNEGTAHSWGWPRSERARRREREHDQAERISELRWLWRSACSGTPLAPMIYTPSGASRAVPLIGHVDLGPPVSITVKIRPGQTIDDFRAAAPAIAPAMNVAELHVIPLVPHWLRIVLLPATAPVRMPTTTAEPDVA